LSHLFNPQRIITFNPIRRARPANSPPGSSCFPARGYIRPAQSSTHSARVPEAPCVSNKERLEPTCTKLKIDSAGDSGKKSNTNKSEALIERFCSEALYKNGAGYRGHTCTVHLCLPLSATRIKLYIDGSTRPPFECLDSSLGTIIEASHIPGTFTYPISGHRSRSRTTRLDGASH